MAVTSIWHIGGRIDHLIEYIENTAKTQKNDDMEELMHIIRYTENPHKTEQKRYVSGINCTPELAVEEFILTKKQFDKTGKRLAYHGYQSFSPGEVDVDTAHAIGVDLAKDMWGKDYEVVVTTHLNTNCLHNHFAINSVSFKTGKKYERSKEEYNRMREISDRLCHEHDLSVIDFPADFKTPRSIYQAEKRGESTLYSIIRDDIDYAISQSKNTFEFNKVIEYMGYSLRYGKYLSLKIEGEQKAVRSYRLGQDYSVDAIKLRCENSRESTPKMWVNIPQPKRIWDYGRFPNMRFDPEFAPLMAVYYLTLSVLMVLVLPIVNQHTLQEKNRRHYISPSLRVELRKLDIYNKHIEFLCRNNIKTLDDLNDYREQTKWKMGVVLNKRTEWNKEIAKEKDPKKCVDLKTKRQILTKELTSYRNEINMCKKIEQCSKTLHEKVEINDKYEQKLKTDHQKQKNNSYER